MDRACSTFGGREEIYMGYWWGNLREREHLGDQGVDGRIILRWIFRKWDVVAWTELIWLGIGKRWRAFVIAVMNIRVL
jgi:hypothetical protein